jgi:hypothetical protein
MANTTTPKTPLYSNISITGSSASLTYTTATTSITDATWAVADTWYAKKPKVQITDSDIEIDGLSLRDTMLAIKKELMIPTRINRNTQLEQEFAELQAVAEQYKELEQKFLEQKKMWETLKKQHR